MACGQDGDLSGSLGDPWSRSQSLNHPGMLACRSPERAQQTSVWGFVMSGHGSGCAQDQRHRASPFTSLGFTFLTCAMEVIKIVPTRGVV